MQCKQVHVCRKELNVQYTEDWGVVQITLQMISRGTCIWLWMNPANPHLPCICCRCPRCEAFQLLHRSCWLCPSVGSSPQAQFQQRTTEVWLPGCHTIWQQRCCVSPPLCGQRFLFLNLWAEPLVMLVVYLNKHISFCAVRALDLGTGSGLGGKVFILFI